VKAQGGIADSASPAPRWRLAGAWLLSAEDWSVEEVGGGLGFKMPTTFAMRPILRSDGGEGINNKLLAAL